MKIFFSSRQTITFNFVLSVLVGAFKDKPLLWESRMGDDNWLDNWFLLISVYTGTVRER